MTNFQTVIARLNPVKRAGIETGSLGSKCRFNITRPTKQQILFHFMDSFGSSDKYI